MEYKFNFPPWNPSTKSKHSYIEAATAAFACSLETILDQQPQSQPSALQQIAAFEEERTSDIAPTASSQEARRFRMLAQNVDRYGPSRVVINAEGESKGSDRAKLEHKIEPVIVFIRDDGWSLGAPAQFLTVAENTWKDKWILVMHKMSDGHWTFRPYAGGAFTCHEMIPVNPEPTIAVTNFEGSEQLGSNQLQPIKLINIEDVIEDPANPRNQEPTVCPSCSALSLIKAHDERGAYSHCKACGFTVSGHLETLPAPAVVLAETIITWEGLPGSGFNPEFTGYTAAPYMTGKPELGWCLYTRDGSGTWNQRTKEILPPEELAQPLRCSDGNWRWTHRVKLVPLDATWTCPKCSVQNVIKAYNMNDRFVSCTNCQMKVTPGEARAMQ